MKKETREKLASLEREVSSEKGEFSLFGLFLREDSQDEDKWDLLVAAPWLEADKKEALAYLAQKIQKHLEPDEILSISRIVVLEKGNPNLENIHKAVKVKQKWVELKENNLFGLPITQACISTSSAVNPTISK
jgi:hypothetical protein